MHFLQQPLSEVLRTNAVHLKLLAELGIHKVADLLEYYPRAYEDRTQVSTLATANVQDRVVIRGILLAIQKSLTKFRKTIVEGVFEDTAGGQCRVLWFNQKYLVQMYHPGDEVVLTGRLKFDHGQLVFMSPEVERVGTTIVHSGRIIPIYPETEGLSSEWLRLKINDLLPLLKDWPDPLPVALREAEGLLDRVTAVREVHFPSSPTVLEQAKHRLSFEELFLLQLQSVARKQRFILQGQTQAKALPVAVDKMRQFTEALPFTLTDDQRIAIYALLKKMATPVPMNCLLEGDVGSGKTVVAVALAWHTQQQQYQVALMVPTEVLARQHYQKVNQLLSPLGMAAELLVGSSSKADRERIKQLLAQQQSVIVIGTQALIQEEITFTNLGLVIIDEQHRFGVEQREKLSVQGFPHVLHMTATPIPRTLAMTIYGDQDIVLLRHLPAGRKPIITRVVPPAKRSQAYQFIRDQLLKGRQGFVICPLIEESDKLGVRAATGEYEQLRQLFPDFNVGLLHGKMPVVEKQRVMGEFQQNQIHILVSTAVVEVGVDIPNATIMWIEGADRFGLAQLHQFRGRVGRGEHQSYCFLFSDATSAMTNQRLKALEKYDNGFDLAEVDLQLRGPGELFGWRQSGFPDLRMATFSDARLIESARRRAEELLTQDPDLKQHPLLQQALAKFTHST